MRRCLYGPVLSRRLGSSLGIDLVPYKICTFDCIYCQLGITTNTTVERREYFPIEPILSELEAFDHEGVDYITLAGSGEPTLNSKMGELIEAIKKITDTPVTVITNGSHLKVRGLQEELSSADLIMPSLDAASQKIFEMINRPHRSLKITDIIEGLRMFRNIFDGEIWLEVMLIKGMNDTPQELELLKEVIDKIGFDKVQLNTVVRPPCDEDVLPLNAHEMRKTCNIFRGHAEIIEFSKSRGATDHEGGKMRSDILELLKRRPCTLEDVVNALGIHRNEVLKHVDMLKQYGVVTARFHEGVRYYSA